MSAQLNFKQQRNPNNKSSLFLFTMLKLLFTCLLSHSYQSGGCLQHNLLATNLAEGNHRLSVN